MQLSNALKLVCIGGGTGLSTLLRGLKRYINANSESYLEDEFTSVNHVALENLTAIV